MKLASLRLVDFRGFEDVTVDLHPSLTVLVGVNGAGKTSVLDAIEIGVSHWVATVFGDEPRAKTIQDRDVRLGQNRCRIDVCAGRVDLSVEHLRGELTVRSPQSLPEGSPPLLPVVFKIDRTALRTAAPTRTAGDLHLGGPSGSAGPSGPSGAGMDWNLHLVASARKRYLTRHPAWDDAVSSGSTSFEQFETWFREREDVENQERVRKKSERRDPGLDAVRRALGELLSGFEDPRIDRALVVGTLETRFVVKKSGQDLYADQLSEGERSLLVLGGTLARALALVDPEAENPLKLDAVVLVDEIELHLHPSWQREVIPALLRTFPNCQFIVTTHSPQVLSSVAQDSILVLDHFHISRAARPTCGRDSTSILVDVMNVAAHPSSIAERLQKIALALDEEDIEQARRDIDALAGELGEMDREVIRLRSLLAFLEPVA